MISYYSYFIISVFLTIPNMHLLGVCLCTSPHLWACGSQCIIIICPGTCPKPGNTQSDFTAAVSYTKWLSNDSHPVCWLFGSVCFPHLTFPTAVHPSHTYIHTHTHWHSLAVGWLMVGWYVEKWEAERETCKCLTRLSWGHITGFVSLVFGLSSHMTWSRPVPASTCRHGADKSTVVCARVLEYTGMCFTLLMMKEELSKCGRLFYWVCKCSSEEAFLKWME